MRTNQYGPVYHRMAAAKLWNTQGELGSHLPFLKKQGLFWDALWELFSNHPGRNSDAGKK